MVIETTDEMFDRELQKLYHAEVEILDLHADLASAAGSTDIQTLFKSHRDDTVDQIDRIEAVFDTLGDEPQERGSPLMEGLLAEKDEFVSEVEDPTLRDLDVLGIGTINERIEITLLDRLLFLADELDLPDSVAENLETNREEARNALENMQSIAAQKRLD